MTDKTQAQTKAAHEATTTHGGAGALDAIQTGRPFGTLAADKEIEVRADFETQGPGAIIIRDAIRLQVVSELYYDTIAKAAQDHDQAKMESALKVWGWVTNSAVRAWDLVRREIKKDEGAAMTQRVLDAIRQAQASDQDQDPKGGKDDQPV